MASAAGSLFARTYAGHTGVDPVHDRRLRRLPGPLRRGHLHRQGPLRRRRLRGGARRPRAGERAALARPVRGALRAHGAGHRRRGRRRLPLERARPRAPAAPLGARRLADPAVAVSRACRRATGIAAQPPAAHRALEDPRQPAAQPGAAGDARSCSCSAGPSCRATPRVWTRRRAWRRWRSRSRPSRSRCCAVRAAASRGRVFLRTAGEDLKTGRGARRAAARLHGQRGVASGCTRSAITLVRLGVTRRRLLEWETAAASAARGGAGAAARASSAAWRRARCWRSRRCDRASLRCGRPRSPVAAADPALWVAAPWIAFALSRPIAAPRRGR